MMSQAANDIESTLLRCATKEFANRFGRKPDAAACAPGRVNLIGDHIDYCDGYVLPAALQFITVVAGSYNGTSSVNLVSITDNGEVLETTFQTHTSENPLKPGSPAWANYVKGVIVNFTDEVKGFDAVIQSNVPMGSGVSSSAALEVATFTFLEALTGKREDLVKKALACQKAEHDFPGMPCGIMDQFISTLAKKNHALLIDCRSLQSTHIPILSAEVVILIINSNVKHQLTGSEYPMRRKNCQDAALILGKPSLRSATLEDLEVLKSKSCDEDVLKRAEHVITEIMRTEEAAKRLRIADYKRVGKLFYESHKSLSELMEVSCPELDQIVDIAKTIPGVMGARMTGGGFGGCVVSLASVGIADLPRDGPFLSSSQDIDALAAELFVVQFIAGLCQAVYVPTYVEITTVHKSSVEEFKEEIKRQYTGNPTFFVCCPGDGARILEVK